MPAPRAGRGSSRVPYGSPNGFPEEDLVGPALAGPCCRPGWQACPRRSDFGVAPPVPHLARRADHRGVAREAVDDRAVNGRVGPNGAALASNPRPGRVRGPHAGGQSFRSTNPSVESLSCGVRSVVGTCQVRRRTATALAIEHVRKAARRPVIKRRCSVGAATTDSYVRKFINKVTGGCG